MKPYRLQIWLSGGWTETEQAHAETLIRDCGGVRTANPDQADVAIFKDLSLLGELGNSVRASTVCCYLYDNGFVRTRFPRTYVSWTNIRSALVTARALTPEPERAD